jgi:Zn-dependent alcohol dehydrogenase
MSVLIGIPQQPITLDMKPLVRGHKTYQGSWGGITHPERDFPMYLAWFQQGKLRLHDLITGSELVIDGDPLPSRISYKMLRTRTQGDGRSTCA